MPAKGLPDLLLAGSLKKLSSPFSHARATGTAFVSNSFNFVSACLSDHHAAADHRVHFLAGLSLSRPAFAKYLSAEVCPCAHYLIRVEAFQLDLPRALLTALVPMAGLHPVYIAIRDLSTPSEHAETIRGLLDIAATVKQETFSSCAVSFFLRSSPLASLPIHMVHFIHHRHFRSSSELAQETKAAADADDASDAQSDDGRSSCAGPGHSPAPAAAPTDQDSSDAYLSSILRRAVLI